MDAEVSEEALITDQRIGPNQILVHHNIEEDGIQFRIYKSDESMS